MRNKIVITLVVLGLLLAACGPTAAPTSAPAVQPTKAPGATTEAKLSGSITVAGSTTVQPLAEALAEAFIALNPDVKIDVQGGGSSVGVKSAGDGTVDIGAASREIKDSEKADYPNMKIFTIAIDGIAIVVHPEVIIGNLTVEQVADIFSGKITDWKDVGGAAGPIVVVSREEGSGTRGAFEELVMGEDNPIVDTAILQSSNGAVRTTVSTTPDSIAYLSFGYLDNTVKALKIAGVEATTSNVLNLSYPIARPLNLLTNGDPQGVVKAWLDWILGPDGQAIVGESYIPVTAKSETPTGLAGTISVAGSTTVQPLAEELAEAFIAANPDVKIDVQGGGSSVGVKSAGQGTVDIGAASREIKDSEKTEYPNMKIFTIAIDGIAIVVHPDVTVADLTVEQVADIFSGKITNWKDVGGEDKLIIVVSREEGSGTRGAFEELVMGEDNPIVDTAILQSSNGAVRTTVSTTPDAIAYLSFGYLDNTVKALMIGGVEATTANVLNKSYPVSRPLNMLTNGDPQGLTKAWLDWILGPDGQAIVGKNYISVK